MTRISPTARALAASAVVPVIPAFAMLAMFALVVSASVAHAQATTSPPPAVQAAEAFQPPARERDADGFVVASSRADARQGEWWNDAVFYQVFVRSFSDARTQVLGGPKSGDGIGDFQGLIERLDYLNDGDPATDTDLGVTALWLLPISPSPSYHGYDITDYLDTHPDYGSREQFQRLLNECEKRGIKVVIDLVLNHTSSKHPWFIEASNVTTRSPKRDWYIWSDQGPGPKGLWGQQIWHKLKQKDAPDDAAERWYFGMFSSQMPDLDFRNPQVSEAMLDVTMRWVRPVPVEPGARQADPTHAFGVHGVRLDAIRHLIEDGDIHENTPATHAWLKQFHAALKLANPEAFSIGEVWSSSEIASTYVGGGDELDAVFEFDLSYAIIRAARTGEAKHIIDAQHKVLTLYPPGQYGRFLTNHDQKRVMNELDDNAGAMRVAASMLLLGPGVPFIYYGEELGTLGDKPDPDLRLPMAWNTVGVSHGFSFVKAWRNSPLDATRRNVESQSKRAESLLNHYRRLIHARMGSDALRRGGLVQLECSDPGVYAFVRTSTSADLAGSSAEDSTARAVGSDAGSLVIINLTEKPAREVRVSLPGGVNAGALAGISPGPVVLAEGFDEAPPVLRGALSTDAARSTRVKQLPARSTLVVKLESR